MSRKKFECSDHRESAVVKHIRWTKISRLQSNLEDRAGVYLFGTSDHKVKYVGSAGAGRLRKEAAQQAKNGKADGATQVKALYTNSTRRAKRLEKKLIHKYQPLNNDRHC